MRPAGSARSMCSGEDEEAVGAGGWHKAEAKTTCAALHCLHCAACRTSGISPLSKASRIPWSPLSRTPTCRCNRMDAVWVPTEFHKQTFAAAGVDPAKLRVVPEPVDGSDFDPARHAALPLPLGTRVFGPRRRHARPGDGVEQEQQRQAEARQQQREQQQNLFVFLSAFKWETRKAGLMGALAARGAGACSPACLWILLSLRAGLMSGPPSHALCACKACWWCSVLCWRRSLPATGQRHALCGTSCTAGLGRAPACLPSDLYCRRRRPPAAAHQALSFRFKLCTADAGGCRNVFCSAVPVFCRASRAEQME